MTGPADEPVLDEAALERLLDMTGGDTGFVDELLDTYLEDGAAQIALLRAASADGDIAGLVRPAHSMKSSSDNVGAARLAHLARALEADSRGGAVDEPVARVSEIATAFDEVRAALGSRPRA